ncbi:hypothetical protein SAMN04489761_1565 [Tenacibaculum sp. MAR_2009_124]|uniref:pyridoxamine 5'-phosphate oxidase family protein n=1 Tax=Tenacibaculum sp. MAR_2009_124 TaxID=1250059 RepID=UPI0008992F0F|nr:pyridoxamine 5'-phosphate oxidase family protein [Tenacibaculum sp. MAR_2009_124]SEB72194.1 hypothetical protein SAMN04489761_1565 [Tenacibaculum sp. MAR_2009_124]
MKIPEEIKESMDKSVLCWLATVSSEGMPNVSPKEVFTYFKDEIIIANIASPQTVKNILTNSLVCISFIDILVQKGYKVKGHASIINKKNELFEDRELELLKITEGKFPFNSLTSITIKEHHKIIAPKYILYPDTTEDAQVKSARSTYGF